MREIAKSALSDQGYQVLEAENGEEALARGPASTTREIALVLTDVVMPKMGGRELVEQLRKVRPGDPRALHVRLHGGLDRRAGRRRARHRVPAQAVRAGRDAGQGARGRSTAPRPSGIQGDADRRLAEIDRRRPRRQGTRTRQVAPLDVRKEVAASLLSTAERSTPPWPPASIAIPKPSSRAPWTCWCCARCSSSRCTAGASPSASSSGRRRCSRVGQGTLYPALYRLERQGLISSAWNVTANNRRARYYKLTAAGRRHVARELASWRRLSRAINLVLARHRSLREHARHGRHSDDRLAEEIAFHIEQQTAKHIARRHAARTRRAAQAPAEVRRRRAGRARPTRDEMRGAWLRDFGRDLRIALPRPGARAVVLGHGDPDARPRHRRRRGDVQRRRRRAAAAAAVPGCRPHRPAVPGQREGPPRRQRLRAELPGLAGADARLRGDGRDRRPSDRPSPAPASRSPCASRTSRRTSST